MATTLAERVLKARKYAHLTQLELAKKCGQAQGTISDLETGKQLSGTFLSTAAWACGVNAIWLERGLGPMVSSDTAKAPEDYGLRRVQLIAFEKTPEWESEVPKAEMDAPRDCLLVAPSVSARSFAFKVVDRSMSPDFQMGDLIVVDASLAAYPGDFVVASADGLPLFRKFRVIRPGEAQVFELAPLNTDYAPIRSDEAAITLLGKVAEHRRTFLRFGG